MTHSSNMSISEAIDRVDALFQHYGNFSLRAELEGRNGQPEEKRLGLTAHDKPIINTTSQRL